MGRRTVLLIAALAVAALGTALVFLYANNAQQNAQQGQELVKVLVAKTSIAVGTTGSAATSAGAFEQQEVPRVNVAQGALGDATPIANLVALVPIFPGQQIISQQWGASGATSGLSLPDGTFAVQVQLGDPERVSGFIAPGSNVAIFTTGKPTTGAGAGQAVARLLLAKVPVVAVGNATAVTTASGSTSNAQQVPSAILTLAVTQDQFQKILLVTKAPGAAYNGLILGLLNDKSKIDPTNPGTSETNLFK